MNRRLNIFLLITGMGLSFTGRSQDTPPSHGAELAKQLANPVASLISVPLQSNVDYGVGPYKGAKYALNIQPVVPIKLSSRWNLITRYILPLVDQHDIGLKGSDEFGLSDATVSAFFSPARSKNGIIWGAGPAFLVPTGTSELLSTRKWGIGPTALILRQVKTLTYGFLTNQLWSFAGDSDRDDVSQLFLQPFFTHNWKSGAGLGINAEMTINWRDGAVTAVLNPSVSAVTKLGGQAISLAVGPRIPLAAPSAGKTDFGFRGVLIFVFPK